MAKDLNKFRIRDTKLILILCGIMVLFSTPIDENEGSLHRMLDMLGSVLVGMCALGRLYCTAFLGGHKNQSLITYGPFSVSRNPLYFCSFLGACGIALISNHLTLMVILPVAFCIVYFALISREEVYLIDHFGDDYKQYCLTTPRFLPNFRKHTVPETVTMYPKFIRRGLKDSLMWLSVLPIFELIEKLQESGILPTFFTFP
jgi:protein-S-isoprenylcysteine O-methyltransferase Ste14